MIPLLAAIHVQEVHPWVYVTIGWTLTAVVIAGYYGRVIMRTRRAERSLPPEDRP